MRKAILALAGGLACWSVAAQEKPMAKEGTVSSVNVTSGAMKAVPVGKERIAFQYDVMGGSLSDTGEGPTHNASMRCVGAFTMVNGSYDDDSGTCVFTRPDGDQVFMTYKASGKVGVTAKGSWAYVGGTGKMAGIQGGGEFTRTPLRAAAEGTTQSVSRGRGTYKLP